MKYAQIQSSCECQAKLFADLDETRCVLRGWAKDMRRKQESTAPAHAIHADQEKFQVGWLCPFCNRNTLRAFDASGLSWRAAPDPAPEPASAAD
ncbi:MAG: hypothetical protein KC766_27410 [Myxococcales bacterium]|nr:hypothetical protein [Myxococcales bacterium]